MIGPTSQPRLGDALGWLPVLATAPQLRADAGDQLAMAERLGQVVVSPELEPAHLVLFRVERGEHDDGQLATSAQLLQHVQPVRIAEVDVEHHQVGLALLVLTHCAGGVVGGDGLQTSPLERKRQQVDQLAIVIDQQDPHVDPAHPELVEGRRQREPHPRTRAELAVDADAATVRLDDALGDGQSKSDAQVTSVSARTR